MIGQLMVLQWGTINRTLRVTGPSGACGAVIPPKKGHVIIGGSSPCSPVKKAKH